MQAIHHGANLQPENLETGEYKISGTAEISDLTPYEVWAYSSDKINILGTEHDIISYHTITSDKVNGIPQAVNFLVPTTDAASADLAYSLQAYGNQSEYVVAHFTVPYAAIKTNMRDLDDAYTGLKTLSGTTTAPTTTLISTPTTLDGYTPRNQKLRQYPFLYVGFNPPSGSNKIYRYEDFTSGTPSFKIISEVNPNPTVNIIPQNYRGKTGDNLSDMASLNGYPQLSTEVDVYNSWLAENTGIINVEQQEKYYNASMDILGNEIGMFTSLGNMFGTAAKGGGTETAGSYGGLFGNAISMSKTAQNYDYYIQKLNAQKERQAMLPNNVSLGGSNATLLGYGLMDDNIFTRYNIKSQFAQRIDKFFDMYGYATNDLKIPNISNRPNWNYIKLAGANLLGEIPETDLQEIKSLFNEGITLWHNTTTFLDYSQNNR